MLFTFSQQAKKKKSNEKQCKSMYVQSSAQ